MHTHIYIMYIRTYTVRDPVTHVATIMRLRLVEYTWCGVIVI